jgi:hypothetical protein
LDVIVTPIAEGEAWNLTDLLGRPMGRITEVSAKQFTIDPEGYALETMAASSMAPSHPLMPLWRPSRSTPGASAGAIRARIDYDQKQTKSRPAPSLRSCGFALAARSRTNSGKPRPCPRSSIRMRRACPALSDQTTASRTQFMTEMISPTHCRTMETGHGQGRTMRQAIASSHITC